MRAVVQRVLEARVRVGEEVVGEIGRGVLAYVGVGRADSRSDAEYLARKLVGLRVFPDAARPLNRSLLEVSGAALVVSQFTLYGDCRKGRRPSFNGAMEPEGAAGLIAALCDALQSEGVPTAQGRFGASMMVESTNWGPVTILLDSKKTF